MSRIPERQQHPLRNPASKSAKQPTSGTESRSRSDRATIRPLTDHELAARLSYFLWSSTPDDELNKLADSKKLRDPKTLSAQANRMLADPKSESFVRNFAGQCFFIVQPTRTSMMPSDRALLFFVLGALLINAFVCSTLSAVEDRYLSRVTWLLPLFVCIAIARRRANAGTPGERSRIKGVSP